jgi:hypothetical protein
METSNKSIIVLPDDMVGAIFSLVDYKWRFILGFVSKYWNEVAKKGKYNIECKYVYFNASIHGYLNLIIWAKESGYPWDGHTVKFAVMHGYLDICKYYAENGMDLIEDDLERASSIGQLDILKWAIEEKGYEYSHRICENAYFWERAHILTWMKENGCKCDGRFHKC